MTEFAQSCRRWFAALLLGTAAVSAGAAEVVEGNIDSREHDFRIVKLASGLHHPWAVAELPDGRFLVTERRGRLALVDDGEIRYLDGLPDISVVGQGGLLDLVLHPRYGDGEHDWIYITYAKAGDGGDATALGRAKLKGGALVDFQELFVQDRFSQPGRHYGSRLAWRADGTLMMTVGERGVERMRAQDTGDHAGSVLRLTDTGAAAPGNPFAGDDQSLGEIYSYGNRNIQGLAVDADDRVWASEHAARGGDELNLIQAGVNYGWPLATHSREYSSEDAIGTEEKSGMRDAVFYYPGRFAPSGLAVVDSERFPGWRGNLLAGGLGSEKLLRLVIRDGEVVDSETLLEGQLGRIRDVRQADDGGIYLLNDTSDAGLYRLEPVAGE